MNLPATIPILFQVRPHPAEKATLYTAAYHGKMRIDNKNFYHFLNSYSKRHGEPFIDMSGDALRFCTVADGVGKGQALSDLIRSTSFDNQKWIGQPDPRVSTFRTYLEAATRAVGSDARAAAIQTLFTYILEGGGLSLAQENPTFRAVMINKCYELLAEEKGAYPSLVTLCNALLKALGDPGTDHILFLALAGVPNAMAKAKASVPPTHDEIVYANWSKLPSEPFRIRLQVADGGIEDALLFASEKMIYSSYYKAKVSIYKHFNRYWKVQETEMPLERPGKFLELLRYYSVLQDRSVSLYDMLLGWKDGDETKLCGCTIDEFTSCTCRECLQLQIIELTRRLETLEKRYR